MFCSAFSLSSQIIVAGFVTNSETKKGISAKIKIKNPSTKRMVAITRSSRSSGSYLTRVKPGYYIVEVSSNGYITQKDTLDLKKVSKNRSTYKDFNLKPAPKKSPPKNKITKDQTTRNPFGLHDSIFLSQKNVGLMMPFYFNNNDIEEKESTNQETVASLEYFQGITLAIDSLKKAGFNIKLNVYDNERDSAKTTEILKSGILKDLDILIGPKFNHLLSQTLRYCHLNKIKNVSPLSVNNLPLLSPYYIMMSPSIETHALELSKMIRKKHLRSHKLLIHDELPNPHEKQFIRFFSKLPFTDTLISHKPSHEDILPKLVKDSLNIILLTSTKYSYSYYVLSQLKLLEEFQFLVIGMPHWVKFEGIDVSYFTNNNVIFSSNCWLDNKSEQIIEFNKEYLSRFKTIPGKFAYQGYDHMMSIYPSIYLDFEQTSEFNYSGLTNDFQIKQMKRLNRVRRLENAKIKMLQFNKDGIIELK